MDKIITFSCYSELNALGILRMAKKEAFHDQETSSELQSECYCVDCLLYVY